MNARNRKLVIVIRTIVGLIFLASGIMGLVSGPTPAGATPDIIALNQSLWSMGILQMIKVTEIVAGLMLVCGFLPALAAIFLAPICIGIIVFAVRVMPPLVVIGVVLSLLNAYLGYAYWEKYKMLFVRG